MSARHLDPAVWAAAYGAAFVHLYAEERRAIDEPPGVMSRRTMALDRVHAPAAVEIADAAVLALHPEGEPCANCGGTGRVETPEDGPEKCHECYGHGSEAMASAYREVDRARNLLRRARKRLVGEPESAVLLVDIDTLLGGARPAKDPPAPTVAGNDSITYVAGDIGQALRDIEDASGVYENSLEALVKARDAAWARLVKAEIDVADCARGEIAGAYDEQRAARQTLRDLGVDVEALLGEP